MRSSECHCVMYNVMAKSDGVQFNILHIVQSVPGGKRDERARRMAIPQPVKPGKFLVHSNLKLIEGRPQRQLYLTGIPIITTVTPPPDNKHGIVVRSVQVRPRPDEALQEQLMEFDKVCKEVKERSTPRKKAAPRTDEDSKHAKIYAILAEYHKKLANSPDLNNKPAPRRRSTPPSSILAKRKKLVASKKSPKEQPTPALVNYIMHPLRIALGTQRLVTMPPPKFMSTIQNQPSSRKVLLLDKPGYMLKQLHMAPESTSEPIPDLPDCEDLGVGTPNTSELFPEADYLMEECLAPFGAEEIIEIPSGDSISPHNKEVEH
ncbi:uncharacterized protein LOC132257045 isoform X2 [Phlebotomus argentipes]|uniref:uncharacterized protein LOC132257045 isoform X2 n=1 Tax=Phlebotomus argentipes TaxID=94469 RepID=UPI002892B9F3|nr:uncharacterized protein LOC132257045 isoform X2 [Phlebotomus argentipes]